MMAELQYRNMIYKSVISIAVRSSAYMYGNFSQCNFGFESPIMRDQTSI